MAQKNTISVEHDPFESASALSTQHGASLSEAAAVIRSGEPIFSSQFLSQRFFQERSEYLERRLSAGAYEEDADEYTSAEKIPHSDRRLKNAGLPDPTFDVSSIVTCKPKSDDVRSVKSRANMKLADMDSSPFIAAAELLPFALGRTRISNSVAKSSIASGGTDFLLNPPLSMDTWDGHPLGAVLSRSTTKQDTDTTSDRRFESAAESQLLSGKFPEDSGSSNKSPTQRGDYSCVSDGAFNSFYRLRIPPGTDSLTVSIEKWSPSLGRGWQWRFFKLCEKERQFVYWEDEELSATAPPRGVINLKQVSRIYADTGTSILLSVPGRDYALRFMYPHQKDAWLDILDVAIYNAKKDEKEAAQNICKTTSCQNGGNTSLSWSSFIEDWVVRPLKLSNEKNYRGAFTVSELAMKRTFLTEKGIFDELIKTWKTEGQRTGGCIIDLRRYVPNITEDASDTLTILAERCAQTIKRPAPVNTAYQWASLLNFISDDMLPESLPMRYRYAVAQLQLIKGQPCPAETILENVIAGCLRFGRQQEGLSDVCMRRYFGLMICSRPVANGKAQHCRDDNLLRKSIQMGSTELKVNMMYIFNCDFTNSPPVGEIDIVSCWEIKSVKETSTDFEWSLKEAPYGRLIKFSCATYRDAACWRMAHVMVKLSAHTDKERGVFLRTLYGGHVNRKMHPRTAPHSLGAKREPDMAPLLSPSDKPVLAPMPTSTRPETNWSRLVLMTFPGTSVIRRHSEPGQGSNVCYDTMRRHYRRSAQQRSPSQDSLSEGRKTNRQQPQNDIETIAYGRRVSTHNM